MRKLRGEQLGSFVPEVDVILEVFGMVGIETGGVVVEEGYGEFGGETTQDVVVVG